MRYADDSFSRLCSQVWQQLGHSREAHEDVDRWHAPSECHELVARGQTEDMRALLHGAGITAREFIMLLEMRTSAKHVWTYCWLEVEQIYHWRPVRHLRHRYA